MNAIVQLSGNGKNKWSRGLGCWYRCPFVLWIKRLKDIRKAPLFQTVLAADPAGWWDPAAETRAVLVTEMRRLWFPNLRGSESLDSIGDPRTMAEQFWWNLRYNIERKLLADSGTSRETSFSSLPVILSLFCLLLSLYSCLFLHVFLIFNNSDNDDNDMNNFIYWAQAKVVGSGGGGEMKNEMLL